MSKRSSRSARARWRRKHNRIASQLRPFVMARDRRRCQYCGAAGDLTLDHVQPLSLGGDTVMGNLVACCGRCNHLKRNLLPLEYFWAWGHRLHVQMTASA